MKTTVTIPLLALLAAAPMLQVAAQTLSDDIPDCAVACVQTAATNVGCKSDLSDTACLCSHLAGFFASAFSCASTNNNCTSGDLGSLNGALSNVCPGTTPSNPGGGGGSSASPSTTKSTVTVTTSASAHPSSSPSSTANHVSPTSTAGAPSNPSNPAATPAASPTTNASAAPTIPAPATPSLTLTPLGLGTGADSASASSTVVLVQTVVLPQSSGNAALGMRAGLGMGGVSAVVAVVGAMLVGGMVL